MKDVEICFWGCYGLMMEVPPRYSCIYLANKDNIEFWHIKALEQLKFQVLPIYEFKATGQIHYADPEWLDVDIVSDD